MRNATDRAIELGIAAGVVAIVLAALLALAEGELTVFAAALGGFGAGIGFVSVVAAVSRSGQRDGGLLTSKQVEMPKLSHSTVAGLGLGALIPLHLLWLVNSWSSGESSLRTIWPVLSATILLVTIFAAIKATARRPGQNG